MALCYVWIYHRRLFFHNFTRLSCVLFGCFIFVFQSSAPRRYRFSAKPYVIGIFVTQLETYCNSLRQAQLGIFFLRMPPVLQILCLVLSKSRTEIYPFISFRNGWFYRTFPTFLWHFVGKQKWPNIEQAIADLLLLNQVLTSSQIKVTVFDFIHSTRPVRFEYPINWELNGITDLVIPIIVYN